MILRLMYQIGLSAAVLVGLSLSLGGCPKLNETPPGMVLPVTAIIGPEGGQASFDLAVGGRVSLTLSENAVSSAVTVTFEELTTAPASPATGVAPIAGHALKIDFGNATLAQPGIAIIPFASFENHPLQCVLARHPGSTEWYLPEQVPTADGTLSVVLTASSELMLVDAAETAAGQQTIKNAGMVKAAVSAERSFQVDEDAFQIKNDFARPPVSWGMSWFTLWYFDHHRDVPLRNKYIDQEEVQQRIVTRANASQDDAFRDLAGVLSHLGDVCGSSQGLALAQRLTVAQTKVALRLWRLPVPLDLLNADAYVTLFGQATGTDGIISSLTDAELAAHSVLAVTCDNGVMQIYDPNYGSIKQLTYGKTGTIHPYSSAGLDCTLFIFGRYLPDDPRTAEFQAIDDIYGNPPIVNLAKPTTVPYLERDAVGISCSGISGGGGTITQWGLSLVDSQSKFVASLAAGQSTPPATIDVALAPGANHIEMFVRDDRGYAVRGYTTVTVLQGVFPVVTIFAINDNDASTSSAAVTLNNTCTGSPTHYMASESPDFSSATWQPYETAPSFTLSPGPGTKTIYFRVKNADAESAVSTDAIEWRAAIATFAINDGDASTTRLAVTLNNTCTGSPTHYMASESPDFSGATWQPYETAPSFTLSPGLGTKTIYFKVKNLVSESAISTDTIELEPPAVTALAINNGEDYIMGPTVTLNNTCAGAPTHYMASEFPDFSDATWQAHDAAPSFVRSSGPGTKTIYFKVMNALGESAVVSDTITAVEMEFVTVGNPANRADTTGFGAVAYTYKIGKYEVTAAQYCVFLNAVAKDDPYGLYDEWMGNDMECHIQRSGESGSYTYTVPADWANRPVTRVDWGDTTRFCNWLTNGMPIGPQGPATTEDGSYYMNGAIIPGDLRYVTRKASARFVIPTENEWYKAAYYNPSAGTYYKYPTSSSTAPGYIHDGESVTNPDPGNYATYGGDYATNGIGAPYYRSEVGEHENSPSPYGTFDQGGNVWEQNETVFVFDHGLRGGGHEDSSFEMMASNRHVYAMFEYPYHEDWWCVGFRVGEMP